MYIYMYVHAATMISWWLQELELWSGWTEAGNEKLSWPYRLPHELHEVLCGRAKPR